jgi:hypothetical protein
MADPSTEDNTATDPVTNNAPAYDAAGECMCSNTALAQSNHK